MPGPRSLGPERALQAIVLTSHDRSVLAAIGNLVSNIIKRKLSQPGSGATYGNHTASSPGEPPAVDTGRLRNSIDHAIGADHVDVGSSVAYAPYLEYGTSRMAARPFMRPAIAEARPLIEALIRERVVIAQRAAIRSLPREIILPP